jgi:hypothetical protein
MEPENILVAEQTAASQTVLNSAELISYTHTYACAHTVHNVVISILLP